MTFDECAEIAWAAGAMAMVASGKSIADMPAWTDLDENKKYMWKATVRLAFKFHGQGRNWREVAKVSETARTLVPFPGMPLVTQTLMRLCDEKCEPEERLDRN